MDKEEVVKWLLIMKANLNNFPEISNSKKIKALGEAIRLLKNEKSELPTESTAKNDLAVDCVSRAYLLDDSKYHTVFNDDTGNFEDVVYREDIEKAPLVTPTRPKGHWLRMSDLSEQEDDRYKCSCCGNVIHHKNKMDLYTFNSWCGRCGSDNGR